MKKNVLVLAMCAFLFSCASTAQSPDPFPKVGEVAPDFSLIDVSGNPVRLSDYKGNQNVVLIFYTDYKEGGNTN